MIMLHGNHMVWAPSFQCTSLSYITYLNQNTLLLPTQNAMMSYYTLIAIMSRAFFPTMWIGIITKSSLKDEWQLSRFMFVITMTAVAIFKRAGLLSETSHTHLSGEIFETFFLTTQLPVLPWPLLQLLWFQPLSPSHTRCHGGSLEDFPTDITSTNVNMVILFSVTLEAPTYACS